MKLSEVKPADVLEFLRVDNTADTAVPLLMKAAEHFIVGYTGLSLQEIDSYEDITDAYLVIIADMYDNRSYAGGKSEVNPMVAQILNLHCNNFLPKAAEDGTV